MTHFGRLRAVVLLALTLGAVPIIVGAEGAANGSVPRFGVFETSLLLPTTPVKPLADARMVVRFTGPSGHEATVDGFYYGGQEWRTRFVPREEGDWRYRAQLTAPGADVVGSGGFVCRGSTGRGFLRASTINPFRLEDDSGAPFYPLGIQTCDFFTPDFDGPNPDGSWRSVSAEEWATAFDGSFNLIRTQFGQGTTAGCALPLIPAKQQGESYDLELAKRIDDTYRLYRAHGYAQILILMQDMSLWGDPSTAFGHGRDLVNYKSVAAANLELQERYLRYVVARYGCFVDIWELFNEDSFAPDDYLQRLARIVREADPYGHLVTSNYARPQAAWSDLITWHEYMGMPEQDVDSYLTKVFALYKSYGKPLLNTEFGNQRILSNVDPVKWRISAWVAFMNETSLLFWGMSGQKDEFGTRKSGNCNAYIGADTREHMRILDRITKACPVDMRPIATGWHDHRDVRSYGLANQTRALLYLHHFSDHAQAHDMRELMAQAGPGRFTVRWIDPTAGKEVAVQHAETAQQFLVLDPPPFTVDLVGWLEKER
jgi:hypothetical protein